MRIAYLDGPWPDFGHRTQRWAHKNPGGNINPPPLFQMYSAAIARQRGHEVALWDAPARGLDYDELLGQVGEFGPDLVVVNTSTPSFDHDMTLVRKLEKSVQAVRVLVGSHVSALPDDVMTQHPEVDIIATGEYDDTISDIAENLSDLSKIGGVVYRKSGGHARTGVRPLMKNLNELPFPAYDLVNVHDYRESMPGAEEADRDHVDEPGLQLPLQLLPVPADLLPGPHAHPHPGEHRRRDPLAEGEVRRPVLLLRGRQLHGLVEARRDARAAHHRREAGHHLGLPLQDRRRHSRAARADEGVRLLHRQVRHRDRRRGVPRAHGEVRTRSARSKTPSKSRRR